MDTATKSPQEARPTDRILAALATLAALLDRTINEVHSVDSAFQKRIAEAVQETEESLQSQAAHRLEEVLTSTRAKLETQFNKRIEELSTEWEAERERLHAELGRITQTTAQWEAERSRLNGEIERLARVQAATQAEAEKAIMAMKAVTSSRPNASANSEALSKEIARAEDLIQQISAVIDDPSVELSIVIRKNVERAELDSYLKGIRFAIGTGKAK
jgi:chromosome segregation ATPase